LIWNVDGRRELESLGNVNGSVRAHKHPSHGSPLTTQQASAMWTVWLMLTVYLWKINLSNMTSAEALLHARCSAWASRTVMEAVRAFRR
jgi:hypothetical protein